MVKKLKRRKKPNKINKPKPPAQLKGKDIPLIRDKLLKQQGGICPICGKKVNAPCLDHSHTKRIKGTGLVRGVLCRGCNIFIAKSENNAIRYGISQSELPTVLRNLAQYLDNSFNNPLPYIHPSEAPPVPKLMKSSYNKLLKWYKGTGRAKAFPPFPKSGKLTKPLLKLYTESGIDPEFYS